MGGAEPLVEPAAQHPLGGVGLLEDLLVHERRRGRRRRTPRGRRRASSAVLARCVVEVLAVRREAGRGDGGQLAVVEVGDLVVWRTSAARSEATYISLVADADDQRGAVAGDDDPVGEVGVHDGDAVGALDRGRARRGPCPRGCRRRTRRPGGRAPRCRCRRPARRRRRSSRCRSAAALSMMPLWTTATRPSASGCGWALTSLAGPWVAQRVWPMPTLPANRLGSASSRSRTRPACLATLTPAAAEHAPRRPSRSRGTRAGPGPRAAAGAACWPPTYPTIPHMCPSMVEVVALSRRRCGAAAAR